MRLLQALQMLLFLLMEKKKVYTPVLPNQALVPPSVELGCTGATAFKMYSGALCKYSNIQVCECIFCYGSFSAELYYQQCRVRLISKAKVFFSVLKVVQYCLC